MQKVSSKKSWRSQNPRNRGATAPSATAESAEATAESAEIVAQLGRILEARRDAATPDGAKVSYTRSLLDAGMPKILAKIAEEHGELADELPAGADGKVVHETADLLFHVMVGLTARRIPIERVFAEFARRFGTSGHVEKASRT